MQVASNPAAGASWPGPEAAPAPAPAQPEPVIGQAASAAADGGSSFANAMLMRDGGRPASNAAWGNPEFAMAPGGQALGVAQMSGPAQAGTVIGYTKPLLLGPPARMFADLPAPSYSGQAMEAFRGRILPRNDDERRGSPGEQDIFSGQQGSGDNEQLHKRPIDDGPFPPGKDGTR